jgi:autotransporter family porin
MNKVFRVVWNAAMQRFVVASELAKGKVKSQSSRTATGSAMRNTVALSGLAIAVAIALPASNVSAAAIIANGATLNYDGQDIVSTANNNESGRGLSASNNGSITFTNGTLTTSGTAGTGAMANTGATITLGNTEIKTTGSSAPGLLSQNNSTINGDGVTITTSGSASYGVQTIDGSATLSNSSITSAAYGVVSQGANGNITLNNTSVNTSGVRGYAVYASKGGLITINGGSLATTGDSAIGAYATGAGSTINIKNSNISTAASAAPGLLAQSSGAINADTVTITTVGSNSYGVQANDGSVTVSNSAITSSAHGTVSQGTQGNLTLNNTTVNTSGDSGHAIYASKGGQVTVNGGALATAGNSAMGAYATGAGSTINIKNSNISTAKNSAPALLSQSNASINADNVTISAVGASSFGVQTIDGSATLSNSSITSSAYGAISQGTLGNLTLNNTTVNTSGDNGHAVYASKGGQITINGSTLAASGHFAAGVYASDVGSTINVANSNISTAGSSAEAVIAQNGGTINVTNSNIFTDRINSYGLRANGANSVVNFDGGSITTTGPTDSVQALYAGSAINIRNAIINTTVKGLTAVSGQIAAENVIINNSGENVPDAMVTDNLTTIGAGIAARLSGANVTIKNSQINSNRGNLLGLRASDGASMTLDNVAFNHSANGAGLVAFNGGTISGDRVSVNIAGQDDAALSSGIWMGMGAGDNSVDLSNSQITLTGANSAGLLFQSDAVSNNALSLSNSAVSASEGTAMMVSGTADTNVTTSGSLLTGSTLLSAGVGNSGTISNVELTGDNGSVFNGDVVIDRTNTAKNIINLDNNSVWNGATTSLETLNVSNGSAWNVSKSSAVDNLTLDNGTLNMTAPGTGYSEVTVGNLTSNNGTLDFKTHLGDDASVTDDLIITGDYTGNSKVVVQNAGGTGAPTINGIELIRVDGNVNGTFAQQGRIVAGAYDYHLVQDGNKWVLRDDVVGGVGGDTGAPVVGDGSGAPIGSGSGAVPVKGKPITRPETGSYAANLAAANTLFTTSLDDRLGETHYIGADGEKHATSLWLRNAGGHTRFSDSSGQLKTTGNRYVMQLGGDIAQWSSNGADRFHLGVMGGYANAQSNTHSNVTGYTSKGQVHGYSTGVYATWLQDNADKTGAYVDSWMLYNWFDNSVKGDGIAEESYKSKGITASVEAGYAFKVAEMSERSSFYLQPKAQATWMGVKADDHKEHNGTRVVGEGDNNVQTRLGVRAYIKGHNAIDDGKNRTFEPFIEANWVHNTESYGSSMNGVSVQQAGARNLGEVKVGVDAKLNQTVNLWGNIGQQMGDKGYSDTSAMVGVKVNF